MIDLISRATERTCAAQLLDKVNWRRTEVIGWHEAGKAFGRKAFGRKAFHRKACPRKACRRKAFCARRLERRRGQVSGYIASDARAPPDALVRWR